VWSMDRLIINSFNYSSRDSSAVFVHIVSIHFLSIMSAEITYHSPSKWINSAHSLVDKGSIVVPYAISESNYTDSIRGQSLKAGNPSMGF
jgi:hypothetical protein